MKPGRPTGKSSELLSVFRKDDIYVVQKTFVFCRVNLMGCRHGVCCL